MIDRGCSTADCAGVPQRLMKLHDLPGEGPWPYCIECADSLAKGGEDDCGPFDPVTVAMIGCGVEALWRHAQREWDWDGTTDEMFAAVQAAVEVVLGAALGQEQKS